MELHDKLRVDYISNRSKSVRSLFASCASAHPRNIHPSPQVAQRPQASSSYHPTPRGSGCRILYCA